MHRAAHRLKAASGTLSLLYSGRPETERDAPRTQEVSDRASVAHRPSREATERPDEGKTGDVYPKPQTLVWGFDHGGGVERRRARCRLRVFAHAP